MKVGYITSYTIVGVTVVIMIAFRRSLVSIYNDQEEVQEIVKQIYMLMIISFIGNCIGSIIYGGIRGLG